MMRRSSPLLPLVDQLCHAAGLRPGGLARLDEPAMWHALMGASHLALVRRETPPTSKLLEATRAVLRAATDLIEGEAVQLHYTVDAYWADWAPIGESDPFAAALLWRVIREAATAAWAASIGRTEEVAA